MVNIFKKRFIGRLSLLIVLFIFLLSTNVFADIGPKPSLTIYVENFESQDYLLDLLVPPDYGYFDMENEFNSAYPEEYKASNLYMFNVDGWKAAHIRSSVLYGSLYGEFDQENNLMVHRFGYVGVPKTFKIIMEKPDGELVISDEVTINQFNAEILYDCQTGEIKQLSKGFFEDIKDQFFDFNSDSFFYRVALTVLLETLLALIFFLKPIKAIVITNLITQILLNISLYVSYFLFNSDFIKMLILMELIILVTEFLIYKKFIKVSNRKLVFYTILANTLSFIVGLKVL